MEKIKSIYHAIICLLLFTVSGCGKCDIPSNCDLTPDPGDCEAYFPKYYFDNDEGVCKEFIWGGWGGVIPFHTLAECEDCNCNN